MLASILLSNKCNNISYQTNKKNSNNDKNNGTDSGVETIKVIV